MLVNHKKRFVFSPVRTGGGVASLRDATAPLVVNPHIVLRLCGVTESDASPRHCCIATCLVVSSPHCAPLMWGTPRQAWQGVGCKSLRGAGPDYGPSSHGGYVLFFMPWTMPPDGQIHRARPIGICLPFPPTQLRHPSDSTPTQVRLKSD